MIAGLERRPLRHEALEAHRELRRNVSVSDQQLFLLLETLYVFDYVSSPSRHKKKYVWNGEEPS
jgi:hypothetical protein